MKIIVNISVISRLHRGMGFFTKQIVKELIKNAKHQYIFVSGNDIDEEIYKVILDSNFIYTQINSPLPIFEQLVLPYLILKYKPDLCWFPSNTFPIIKVTKTKYVVTIHDMIFFNKSIKPKKLYQKIGQLYRKYNLLFGIKKIDTVTSVSKTSLNEINKYLDWGTYKEDYVLYNNFLPSEKKENSILEKLDLKEYSYFYSITGIAPHKNLDLLIKSFLNFQKFNNNYKLVISGSSNSSYVNQYDNIIFTPYISELEKFSLIENAKVFIFPSLIEGFGIPLIEGLYYNINTLVSDIKIFREIGQDYVNYFDPNNEDFLLDYFNQDKKIINHEEAKQYIVDNFNLLRTTSKLEKIFNEIK